MNRKQRSKILQTLSPDEIAILSYEWNALFARPLTRHANGFFGGQVAPPGSWQIWTICAGRGYGKTRCGGEWIRDQVENKGKRRIAIVAATAADARDTLVEGESGILAISPPWNRPTYEPSKRRLTWPNGARATLFSADEPDRLRGPQHDAAWGDELAAWRYADAYDQLMLGLRLGDNPQVVFTTTPRPTPIMLELFKRAADGSGEVVISHGSTYENKANLAPSFVKNIIRKYEGTRLGRQELFAELLTDVPGALWKRDLLEALRVTQIPELYRVVVGVDPAVTSNEDSAETGIVVVGRGSDGRGYVIDDCSLQGSPSDWGKAVVAAYHKHHADAVIGETNQGGDLVERNIRVTSGGEFLTFRAVHAKRGKYTRAEPIAGLYEQKRFHHFGLFGSLEDQMCTWLQGEKSPDRLDAMVWAATDLFDEFSGNYDIFDLFDENTGEDEFEIIPDRPEKAKAA